MKKENHNPNRVYSASQRLRILAHLKSGKNITAYEALRKYQCLRLGARIWELKEVGHNITSTLHLMPNGKYVARYRLCKSGLQ